MNIAELLDAAKRKQGSLGAVAAHFGFNQTRLSAWRSGERKPNATQIAQLAELADLPVFETVAEVEASLEHGDGAKVWERALGKLRAAGVAATVILTLATCLTTSHEARAAGFENHPFRQNFSKIPAKSMICGDFCLVRQQTDYPMSRPTLPGS